MINMLGAGIALYALFDGISDVHRMLIGTYGEAEFVFACVDMQCETLTGTLTYADNCIALPAPLKS